MADGLEIEKRSVCVGPYTLDVPVGWTRQQKSLDAGGDATFYFGRDENFVKIDAVVVDDRERSAFEAGVLQREGELKAREHFAHDGSMFVSRETVGDGMALIQSYASVDTTDAIRMEVHGALPTSSVVLSQTAYAPDARDAVRARLLAALASVREIDPGTAPASVFCIGRVAFDLASDYEEAEIGYAGRTLDASAALRMDINTFAEAAEEPSLLVRGEANLEGLGVRPQRLRAGARPLAGDDGEEWLGAFVEDGTRIQAFYAETTTKTPTSVHPKLLVSLSVGESGAMDDGTAVALWDQILPTLRKR
ncbi:T6SS immunity protein Tli4 family protein [Luteimonas abyssi]|uniref:T6SS immunity protein Tli4 family protein n=1 Tax=Luteimonas abyssi TaxID=1247514 RepID=UPI000737B241|nr:T6SS immunity protein Tli4 family protein [Luteimonas abyssi]